eukprot:TRINITY_DN2434_c0_g2_i2.p1 TRINITY_DN2434_c0_g2~~TRINITY_DN2434_c0_g2_i2.p1  ORF type:complete len:219 (+),score=15.14 TRINITY_DN2434_c0_g2_i2:3-659(+)
MKHSLAEYVCSYDGCHQSFTTHANQKRHERLHTGEKPFVCEIEGCGKKFARSYDLKVHGRVHTKEKPYRCAVPHCRRKFSRCSALREHERRLHNGRHLDRNGVSSTIQKSKRQRSEETQPQYNDTPISKENRGMEMPSGIMIIPKDPTESIQHTVVREMVSNYIQMTQLVHRTEISVEDLLPDRPQKLLNTYDLQQVQSFPGEFLDNVLIGEEPPFVL